ncbi:site-specific integrase [Paenibacillus frigoriresistens]|uniref:site-specific integrase n=1 Tax=Paenibacillus alginolyticus TaxID=59839 RepID=UPI0015674AC2|nr:site-specific integrase [Paenibacillus frigoriresistens]NRF94845.1 site-specific integrase [Paenibacillus frigoriresistens]
MSLEWVPLETFRRYLKETLHINSVASTFCLMKKAVFLLQTTYPNPQDWLAIKPEERLSFRGGDRSELWYIIFWIWDSGYCEGEDQEAISRRTDIIKYISTRGRVDLADFPVKLGLLTNAEAEFIRNKDVSKKGLLNKLAIHMVSVMKPLDQFTEKDILLADLMRPNDKRYNAKVLRDILYELGHSDMPGKRRHRTYLDECCEHTRWGRISEDYRQHLKRSDALDYYMRKAGAALFRFYAWLDKREEPDASLLEYEDYLDLFDYFSLNAEGDKFSSKYIGNSLSFIKAFLEWGNGHHSFFPKQLDWPKDLYSGIHREAQGETYAGDGLAFDDPEFPALMKGAIESYQPDDDLEALCRAFWLVIASSPVRKTYLLNLQVDDCVLPLPNAPAAVGLYSPYSGIEKAKHRNGQFPILDSSGIRALNFLRKRANEHAFRPMWNERAEATYVHLFQLKEFPWLLNEKQIYMFFDKIAESIGHKDKKGKAHGYRHYLITHIAIETGNSALARLAAGHENDTMLNRYLRSNLSRKALLFATMKKYQDGDIAGRFIWRIFEALADDQMEPDELIKALGSEEITLDEFFAKFGLPAPTGVGKCLIQGACIFEAKCFSCHHYAIRKSEAAQAFRTLARLTKEMWNMMQGSRDFTTQNSKAAGLMTQIALLGDMIRHFGYSEDQIQMEIIKQI